MNNNRVKQRLKKETNNKESIIVCLSEVFVKGINFSWREGLLFSLAVLVVEVIWKPGKETAGLKVGDLLLLS